MTKIAKSQYTSVGEMYLSGMTQPQVGAAFGVTHSVICQILKKLGVSRARVPSRAHERKAAEVADRILNVWGLNVPDYEAIIAEYGSPAEKRSPMRKFKAQRRGAKARGIAWQFTFAEWWRVWLESGKWPERAQGGYVMARRDDGETPYSPSTVYICTSSQNIKDAAINVPAHTRRNARLTGAGRGYSVDPRCTKSPYFAQFGGKALGNFSTPEAARAAYLAAAEEYKRSKP